MIITSRRLERHSETPEIVQTLSKQNKMLRRITGTLSYIRIHNRTDKLSNGMSNRLSESSSTTIETIDQTFLIPSSCSHFHTSRIYIKTRTVKSRFNYITVIWTTKCPSGHCPDTFKSLESNEFNLFNYVHKCTNRAVFRWRVDIQCSSLCIILASGHILWSSVVNLMRALYFYDVFWSSVQRPFNLPHLQGIS